MSRLTIFKETNPNRAHFMTTDVTKIISELAEIGVEFRRWNADRKLDAEATQDEIIEAYRSSIDELMNRYEFKSVDVISMNASHPQKDQIRDKFLHEHTHDDFEVRFFVEGEGVFYIRKNGKVYATLCKRGDLISVPANTLHWFDMGPEPQLKAIRLFADDQGWVPHFTGDTIADRFPRLDTIELAA